MPPKRHNSTTNPFAGKTSSGSAHPRQRDGGKSGYSTIFCKNKIDCNNPFCTYIGHTNKEDLTIKEAQRRAAANKLQVPIFDKRSHLPVPDPQKDHFLEFLPSQMKVFYSVLVKGMPDLLKTLLISNKGVFEAIGSSFMSAKDYDTFLASLKTFGVSINELRIFVLNKKTTFSMMQENHSSEDSSESEDSSSDSSDSEDSSSDSSDSEDSSSDSSDSSDSEDSSSGSEGSVAEDPVNFWNSFSRLIIVLLRGSIPEPDIRTYFGGIKPAGTYETFFAQLFAFYKDLETFIQSVEQSWNEINRSVLKVETCHVSFTSFNDSRLLNAMLQSEITNLEKSPSEDSKKACAVIQLWLNTIQRFSTIGIPIHLILTKELLTQIGNTVPSLKAHVEDMTSYKKSLKVKTDLDNLRSLNLSSLCSGKVQRVDASDVVLSCCFAFSVLKGKLATVFSDWAKKLSRELNDSINDRFGDFFNLLQSEFLRILSKKKNQSFFDALQPEKELSAKEVESRNTLLVEALNKVFVQFEENVSSSHQEILKKLQDISVNDEDFRPVFDLLFSVLPIKGTSPIINAKVVDFLVKNLKMVFDDHLKVEISPTGVKFGLTYGLEKGQEPVDVTENISLFLVRMLCLNRHIVVCKGTPFSGNLRFHNKVMTLENDTIAKALVKTLQDMTGNDSSSNFATVLSLKCRHSVKEEGEEFPSRVRFDHFLITLFDNCVLEKVLRNDFIDLVKQLKTEAATLFSTLKSKGLKDLLLSILTSCYKPSQSSSMMKMFNQGWVHLFSKDNHRIMLELSSFVGTPFDKLDESSFPSRDLFFSVIDDVYISDKDKKDKKDVLKDFYKSLWKVLSFILSNLSSMDMARVYSLYTMLEFFNANSRNYTFAHYFPYATHFFCALLVALQNIGLSLEDALKLFSKAITNADFLKKLPTGIKKNDDMMEWLKKASTTSTTDFTQKKKMYDQKNKTRTQLEDKTPYPIKFILQALLSQSVSTAPDELVKDISNVVYLLFAQDNFCQSPCTQTLLNTMFSFVSMSLSTKSTEFFKLYGIDADRRIAVGGGNDGTCYDAFLRTLLPSIRVMVTQQMCDAMFSVKEEDNKCPDAYSFLAPTDISTRSKKIRADLVLSLFRQLVSNMGIVSMSSIEAIQTIGGVIKHITSKQSFVDSIFLEELKNSLFFFAFSYRDAGKEAYNVRKLRRELWEKRQAELAVVDSAAREDDDDEQQTSSEFVSVSALASATVVQISSNELRDLLSEELREMFDSFRPSLILIAGLIVNVLRSILRIKDSNAKDARYTEICKAFPEFFQDAFLLTCFEMEFFSKLTTDFVDKLESSFKKKYSSKVLFCDSLELDPTEQILSYLDACFRETREKVLVFIATQPSLTDVQLPESFPDSNADDADDADEADDSDEADEADDADDAESDDDLPCCSCQDQGKTCTMCQAD